MNCHFNGALLILYMSAFITGPDAKTKTEITSLKLLSDLLHKRIYGLMECVSVCGVCVYRSVY